MDIELPNGTQFVLTKNHEDIYRLKGTKGLRRDVIQAAYALGRAAGKSIDNLTTHMLIISSGGPTVPWQEEFEWAYCRYCRAASTRWGRKVFCKHHQKFIAERHINLHRQKIHEKCN